MLNTRPHVAVLIAALITTACSSNSGTTFTAAPTPPPANMSGDYAGTWTDAQSGAGTAAGTLSQHGANAGGGITITQTSGSIVAQMAIAVSSSNATSGSMVVNYPSGTTCTFSTTGTYANNGTTAVLSGTYTAVTNCAGDSGSYTLNQQCTNTVTANARRSMVFPKPC